MSPSQARRTGALCSQSIELSTPYNDDERIPSYVGVMFQLLAKSPIDIFSFELDVKNSTDDLSIEVYTTLEKFEEVINNSSAWTLVANAKGVMSPGGNGLVIPSENFQSFSMAAGELRSLYITMKGSFIESTAYALHKTGELYMGDENLNIMVGAGLTAYKFPQDRDRTINPQFAGAVHYKRTVDCNKAVTETLIQYPYLVQNSDLISNAALAGFVQEAADEVLKRNQALVHYRTQFSLQRYGDATTVTSPYNGRCPDIWSSCPTSIFNTTLAFIHRDSLDSDAVRYEFSRSRSFVDLALSKKLTGVESLFVGDDAVSASFSLTINGVPKGTTMDATQLKYFDDMSKVFLNTEMKESYSTIMGVRVDSSALAPTRRRLRGLGANGGIGASQVKGKVFGIQPVGLSSNGFRDSLDTVLRNTQPQFISSLQSNSLVTPIAVKELEYFSHIESLTGEFTADQVAAPTVAPNETTADNWTVKVFTAIAGVAVSLLGVLFLLFARKRWKLRRSYLQDVKKYREWMRSQRRQRREDKEKRRQGNIDSDRSGPPTPASSTASSNAESDLIMSEEALRIGNIETEASHESQYGSESLYVPAALFRSNETTEPTSEPIETMPPRAGSRSSEYGTESLYKPEAQFCNVEAPGSEYGKESLYKPAAQIRTGAPLDVTTKEEQPTVAATKSSANAGTSGNSDSCERANPRPSKSLSKSEIKTGRPKGTEAVHDSSTARFLSVWRIFSGPSLPRDETEKDQPPPVLNQGGQVRSRSVNNLENCGTKKTLKKSKSASMGSTDTSKQAKKAKSKVDDRTAASSEGGGSSSVTKKASTPKASTSATPVISEVKAEGGLSGPKVIRAKSRKLPKKSLSSSDVGESKSEPFNVSTSSEIGVGEAANQNATKGKVKTGGAIRTRSQSFSERPTSKKESKKQASFTSLPAAGTEDQSNNEKNRPQDALQTETGMKPPLKRKVTASNLKPDDDEVEVISKMKVPLKRKNSKDGLTPNPQFPGKTKTTKITSEDSSKGLTPTQGAAVTKSTLGNDAQTKMKRSQSLDESGQATKPIASKSSSARNVKSTLNKTSITTPAGAKTARAALSRSKSMEQPKTKSTIEEGTVVSTPGLKRDESSKNPTAASIKKTKPPLAKTAKTAVPVEVD